MKKLFVLIVLALVALFAFNVGRIYAEEITNETQNIGEQEVQGNNEPTNEPIESPKAEEPAKENVPETPSSNETITVEPVSEPVTNETVQEVIVDGESNTTVVDEPTPVVTEEPTPVVETNETTTEGDDDIHGGEIYDIQKVKVITKKIDEEGNFLEGAKLQIIDSKGNVVDEWTSTNEAHETLLPDGTYTLHEVEAPEGYDLAEDKEFTVKVEIAQLDAGSEASATPCPHYTGTQMYYVEIEGKRHEVYCINQNWDTPDDDSIYDGEILNAGSIRDYTKQTVPVGLQEDNVTKVVMSDGPIDISDQTLSDEELYDKILDIIYHRHLASEELGKQGYTYTTEEIRFITEVALKNYTNPGLTERQYGVRATEALLAAFDAAGVVYGTYTSNGKLYVSYLKHNYRDYVYDPNVPLGQDIVKTDYGKGNSFGQMVAGHWNNYSNTNYLHPDADPATQAHNAKNKQADRDTVARYYVLFEFLISNSNPHPEDMNLYIYSSQTVPADPAGNNNDAKYQNLLGVTGYFEDIKQQELEVEMVNKYSTETREIKVEKVWDDKENYNNLRPKTVTIILKADGEVIDSVELDDVVEWKYTWTDLAKYNNGKLITYTIEESEVPEYDVEITGDMDTVFIVTNSYYGEGGDVPPENPKTGDSIYLYISMLLISLIGLIKYTNTYIKNN